MQHRGPPLLSRSKAEFGLAHSGFNTDPQGRAAFSIGVIDIVAAIGLQAAAHLRGAYSLADINYSSGILGQHDGQFANSRLYTCVEIILEIPLREMADEPVDLLLQRLHWR